MRSRSEEEGKRCNSLFRTCTGSFGLRRAHLRTGSFGRAALHSTPGLSFFLRAQRCAKSWSTQLLPPPHAETHKEPTDQHFFFCHRAQSHAILPHSNRIEPLAATYGWARSSPFAAHRVVCREFFWPAALSQYELLRWADFSLSRAACTKPSWVSAKPSRFFCVEPLFWVKPLFEPSRAELDNQTDLISVFFCPFWLFWCKLRGLFFIIGYLSSCF